MQLLFNFKDNWILVKFKHIRLSTKSLAYWYMSAQSNHFLNWSCSCLLLWQCSLDTFHIENLTHRQFSGSQTTFVIIRLYMVVRDIIVLFWHFPSIFVSKVSLVTHDAGKGSMDKAEELRVKRLRDTHRTLSATHPLILTDKRIYSPLVNEVMASTATTFGIM